MIQVQVPERTFMPVTEPIEFSFDAPTWSLGKSMAAHIAIGRIGEVYHKDLNYMMTHKYRGSIIVLLISKSVEPNEEQKEMISGFQQGILYKH